jgi:4-cresol dehydrogenase (hydroxylating)
MRPLSPENVFHAEAQACPVLPASGDRNWGYRSRRDRGQAHGLGLGNRILDVNRELGYAVIEPGVTQGQLADYLRAHAPELMIDATGAGPDASLVGNTLDRGFGHTPYGDHCGLCCAAEIVLGDGRVLRTGLGALRAEGDGSVDGGPKAEHVYRYGVGPSLDGLFSQANFGVVTRLTVWLMRRPEKIGTFFCQVDGDALPALVDALARLKQDGVIHNAVHVGNDLRLISGWRGYPFDRTGGATPLPEGVRAELRKEEGVGVWNAAGAFYGTKAQVRACHAAARRALKPFGYRYLDGTRLRLARCVSAMTGWTAAGRTLSRQLDRFEPVWKLLHGEPTYDFLRGPMWRVRDDDGGPITNLDDTEAGLKWVSPLGRAMGADAVAIESILEPIYARHGFDLPITFTLISPRAMIGVTNLSWDLREAAEGEAAAACYAEAVAALLDAGYPPYRAGGEGQRMIAERIDPVTRDVRSRLKDIFDPRGQIEPGRHGIVNSHAAPARQAG